MTSVAYRAASTALETAASQARDVNARGRAGHLSSFASDRFVTPYWSIVSIDPAAESARRLTKRKT